MNITTGWVIKRQHYCKLAEQPVFWCICRLGEEESWASISKNYSPRIFASEEEAAEQCKKFTECEIVPFALALEGKHVEPEVLCGEWLRKYAAEFARESGTRQHEIVGWLDRHGAQRSHLCRFGIHINSFSGDRAQRNFRYIDLLKKAGAFDHIIVWVRHVISVSRTSKTLANNLCDILEAEDARLEQLRLETEKNAPKPVALLPLTEIGDQPLRTVGELRQFIAELDDSMLLQSDTAPGRYSCPIIARAHKAKRPRKTDYRKHPNLYLTGYRQHGNDPDLSESWKELTDNSTA